MNVAAVPCRLSATGVGDVGAFTHDGNIAGSQSNGHRQEIQRDCGLIPRSHSNGRVSPLTLKAEEPVSVTCVIVRVAVPVW